MTDPRILYFDTETSHDIVAKFGLREEYVNPDNILHDWHILSAAWSWETTYNVCGMHINKPGKDREVCKALSDAIRKADVIIGHNSDEFDIKKLNTRLIYHRMKPLPPVKTVDTKKLAKKHFAFTSNSMNYIAKFLGHEGKSKTDNTLWLRALQGEKKAYQEMLLYNKQDVIVLKNVAKEMAPYVEPYINASLFYGSDCCPKCESQEYKFDGYRYTSQGKFRRYECLDCGKHWQSTKSSRKVSIK